MKTPPRAAIKGELADALRAIAPAYGDAAHRRVASEFDARRLPQMESVGIKCAICAAESARRTFVRGNMPPGPAIDWVPGGEHWGRFFDDGALRYLCPACKLAKRGAA